MVSINSSSSSNNVDYTSMMDIETNSNTDLKVENSVDQILASQHERLIDTMDEVVIIPEGLSRTVERFSVEADSITVNEEDKLVRDALSSSLSQRYDC